MTWATGPEVTAITGKDTTPENLTLASSIIDTFSGADEEMPEDSITAIDRKHLKRATAWQAVWIAGKPGLIEQRENAESVTSDTQAITRGDNADGLLAPLAKRELASLSWVGTRSVRMAPPRPPVPPNVDFLNESSDGYGVWKPLNV